MKIFCFWLLLSAASGTFGLYAQADSAFAVRTELWYYNLFSQKSSSHSSFADGYLSETRAVYSRDDYGITGYFRKSNLSWRVQSGIDEINYYTGSKFSSASISAYGKQPMPGVPFTVFFNAGAEIIRSERTVTENASLFNFSAETVLHYTGYASPYYSFEISRRTFPFRFTATYASEELILSNQLSFLSLQHTAGANIGGVTFHAGYLTLYPQELQTDDRFVLQGKHYLYQAFSGAQFGIGATVLSFTANRYTMRGVLNPATQNLQFGNLQLQNIEVNRVKADCSFPLSPGKWSLNTGLDNFYLKGNVSGHLESWPFATVIQSLFVNRLYIKTSLSAVVQSLFVRANYNAGNITIHPSIEYYRILPSLQVQTWQPAFLVFGISNLKESRLDITDCGIVNAGLRVTARINEWSVEFAANQLLPVYINRIQKETVPGVPGTPGEQITTDGGRWLGLTVTYSF